MSSPSNCVKCQQRSGIGYWIPYNSRTSCALDLQYTLFPTTILLEGVHQRGRHGEESPLSIGWRASRSSGGCCRVDNTRVGGFYGGPIGRGIQRGHCISDVGGERLKSNSRGGWVLCKIRVALPCSACGAAIDPSSRLNAGSVISPSRNTLRPTTVASPSASLTAATADDSDCSSLLIESSKVRRATETPSIHFHALPPSTNEST